MMERAPAAKLETSHDQLLWSILAAAAFISLSREGGTLSVVEMADVLFSEMQSRSNEGEGTYSLGGKSE